jgi:hypothetical protein
VPDSEPSEKAITARVFSTASVSREPVAPPDAGPVARLWSRSGAAPSSLTRFQRADSRHATPVRACISPDLRSLSGAFPNAVF